MAVTTLEGAESSAFAYGRHNFEEDIPLTTTFRNVLLLDARKVRQSVITFNNVGGNNLNYRIYAASKPIPGVLQHIADPTDSAVNKDNIEWVNLLSIIAGDTGITYQHDFSKQLDNGLRFYESFSNEWFALLVTAASISSTTDLSIWHRGQS